MKKLVCIKYTNKCPYNTRSFYKSSRDDFLRIIGRSTKNGWINTTFYYINNKLHMAGDIKTNNSITFTRFMFKEHL